MFLCTAQKGFRTPKPQTAASSMEQPPTLKSTATAAASTSTPTVQNPFWSHPHRRSRLKSESYSTLLRILSYCRDHPQLLQTQPGNGGSEPRSETREEVYESVEFIQPSSDHGKLENMMSADTGVKDGSDEGVDLRGGEVEVEKLLVDEIGRVTKRGEEADHGMIVSGFSKLNGNEPSESFFQRNGDFGGNSEMNKNMTETDKLVRTDGKMGSPILIFGDDAMEEGEISGKLQGRLLSSFPEVVVCPKEKGLGEQPVVGVSVKGKLSFDGKAEASMKDTGSTSIVVNHMDNSSNSKELESMDALRKEMPCNRKVVVYEDPILAEQTGPGGKRKRAFGGEEKKKSRKSKKQCQGSEAKDQRKGSGAMNKKRQVGDVALEQEVDAILKNGIGCKLASSSPLDSQSEKSNQGVSGSVQVEVNGMQNADQLRKKKRGPPSAEKRAKKKQKERKRRAEKNRELGVKRLRLKPVVKPKKPVTFCRHYLMGRCREGEKCNYSHDTTPLTKSKPCCHFARHSCMKGDDCPFDHQLSKYPCANYSSKGSCSRGENCLFSHVLPDKEESPSSVNALAPSLKPPSLPSASYSKKLLDRSGTSTSALNSAFDSTKVASHENAESDELKTAPNRPAHVPKGISFFSPGKSSTAESADSKLDHTSLKSDQRVKIGSQNDQSTLKMDKKGETPKQTPPTTASTGVNFLSFGKAPHGISLKGSLKELSSSASFSMQKQVTSSSYVYNNVRVGEEPSQAVKSNPFSSREASASSRSNLEASLISNVHGGGVGKSVQLLKTASDEPQNSGTIKCISQASSASGSDHLMHAYLKNTPTTAQKTLLSTLAFAESLNLKQR